MAENGSLPEGTLSSEGERTFVKRAKFIELTEDAASQQPGNLEQLLSGLLPEGSTIGNLLFRRIRLPEDRQKRTKRIEEILKSGTDRTKRWHTSKWSLFGDVEFPYKNFVKEHNKGLTKEQKLNPFNVIFAYKGERIQEQVRKYGFKNALMSGEDAVLVYDSNCFQQIMDIEYSFKYPDRKEEALLGIIAIRLPVVK